MGTDPDNLIAINHKPNDNNTLGNSLAGEQPSSHPSSFSVFECYQNHIKWPEFAAHAKRLGKPPTAEWFKRWLVKQKPQWPNKKSPRQEVLEEFGYTLDGKFYTSAEANGLGTKDPNLIEKFRPATQHFDQCHLRVIAPGSQRTVIRVCDDAGNVIETHEHEEGCVSSS